MSILRPTDNAPMRVLSAPDANTLRVGGGNQTIVEIVAHTTPQITCTIAGITKFGPSNASATFIDQVVGARLYQYDAGGSVALNLIQTNQPTYFNSGSGVVVGSSTGGNTTFEVHGTTRLGWQGSGFFDFTQNSMSHYYQTTADKRMEYSQLAHACGH